MRIENMPEGMTVHLSGEIDHHAARAIREQIDIAIEQTKPSELTLDFTDVGFMDSSGIGLIMGRYRAVQLYGGGVALTGMSPSIRKVVQLAGLDRLNLIREESEAK